MNFFTVSQEAAAVHEKWCKKNGKCLIVWKVAVGVHVSVCIITCKSLFVILSCFCIFVQCCSDS